MPPPPEPERASDPPEWTRDPFCPRLGRFLVGPELGRGGMGRVHEAWDPLLQRRVALKRLGGGTAEEVLRFSREAKHQALVTHPHICPIYEVGADPQAPYIVMYRVEGIPLSELHPDPDPPTAARLIADVAGAIHAAHRAQLVHRDLKPQNILVERREDGSLKPWVVDFGLARDLSRADLTLTWAFSGTPAFMSPAQARGEAPSPADDIFSLGATLYALLSGVPPFEATTLVGLLDRQTTCEPPALRRRRPELPRDLDTIVATCLDPDPARRYATAFDLESDLRRFLAGEPIQARPTPWPWRAWRRIRRHRALAATVAVSALLLGGLAGWNVHLRVAAGRQAELATRFGFEVKDLEDFMRLERLMPVHDLRPAEARLRQGGDRIRAEMAQLGPAAEGPGHYALGRLDLALREDKAALAELDRAWAAGFRSPECAYARGTALARLFARDFLREAPAGSSQRARAAVQQRLMAQWGNPALACFALSHGQSLDNPAFGEAQIDWLQGDAATCVQKCREAYAAAPWLVEAKGLEWEALQSLAEARQVAGDLAGRDAFLVQARQTLTEGMERAPSDASLLGRAVEDLGQEAARESSEGHVTPAVFRRGDELFARAMQIQPGDPTMANRLATLRLREAIYNAAHGKDGRPLLEGALRLVESTTPRNQWKDTCLAHVAWTLGSVQRLWGEDPRPALNLARGLYPPGMPEQAELDLIEARYWLARGRDPDAPLRAARQLCQARVQRDGPDFYILQILGEACCLQARWASAQGLDPTEPIQAGLKALDGSQALYATNAYGWWDRALMEALGAEWTAAKGGDPAPGLARAHRAAARGMALRPDHYRSLWTQAEVFLIEARLRRDRGLDPAPALEAARKVVTRGLAANRTSSQLWQVLAQVEALAGHWQASADAARRGLALKPDAIVLWVELARAERRQGEGVKARRDLQKALAEGPDWRPARAEARACAAPA